MRVKESEHPKETHNKEQIENGDMAFKGSNRLKD